MERLHDEDKPLNISSDNIMPDTTNHLNDVLIKGDNNLIEKSNHGVNEQNCENSNGEQTTGSNDNVSGHGAVVAAHYNKLEEKGLSVRNQSRIVHLRNFNNWIKSMLINEFLSKIRDSIPTGNPLKVLDMCCGKGGDLNKWRSGNITHLVCVDLAETSVKQCQKRYEDIEERMKTERYHNNKTIFSAEFIPADCTKIRLRSHYKDPSMSLNLVSCQFSFHYSFESLAQAETMLQNASECLQPGGYFIGTMPDANEIMSRLEASDGLSFGNDVYSITFENNKKPYPLFGGKYDFHLEGVVDCPEFLVHFPTLERLARKYGLELVQKENFEHFYKRMIKPFSGKVLLEKMQALETYPAHKDNKLAGNTDIDYKHAEEHIKNSERTNIVGTLSMPEWEAATLYLVFAFQKMTPVIGSNNKTTYEPYVNKYRNKRKYEEDYNRESSSYNKVKRTSL